MGDLNGDGYLDFAIGAPGHADGQGSIYLMNSDGTAGPAFDGCNPNAGGGDGGGVTPPDTGGDTGGDTGSGSTKKKRTPRVSLAKRTIRFRTTGKTSVTAGQLVTMKGRLRALTRKSSCQRRQKVAIQRLEHAPQADFYLTIDVAITKRDGTFASSTRPAPAPKTFFYRARVTQTKRCKQAVSKRVKVVATLPKQ
jgi:hypothetical protein